MKMMIWSSAALVGLFLTAVTVMETKEPVPANATSPRVVRHGQMSVSRAAHQATVLENGDVLITGGCDDNGCERLLASAELYDPATRAFRNVAPMSTPRASHEAIALPDGRVLVTGGWTGSQGTAAAEIYDPATGRWTSAGEMLEARVSHNAVPLQDGRVLIVGGNGESASAEVFDPATGRFSAVGPMRPNAGSYLPIALADGRVLVAGGETRAAQIFDPSTGEFRPTGDMIVPRQKHAAARLPDGRVLIIGGSNDRGYRGRFASTEIYNPAAGEFSRGPDMRWGRHKIRDAVVAFPSGAVLVAGGAARPELWDPAGRVFVPLQGELSGPQMFATATLLHTGEVLVLGGYDHRIRPSALAWLVRPAR